MDTESKFIITASSATFKRLEGLAKSASKDQSRPVLCNMFLHTDQRGKVVAVTTDSYQLVRVTFDAPVGIHDGEPIQVPAKDWAAACKTAAALKANEASIIFTPLQWGLINQAGDAVASATFTMQSGDYPKYEALIPDHAGIEAMTHVAFNPAYLSTLAASMPHKDGALRIRSMVSESKPIIFDSAWGTTARSTFETQYEWLGLLMPVKTSID